MKVIIEDPGASILTLLRKAGYHSLRDSFARPLGRSGYPRFHIYIEKEKDRLILNLHLDQRKPVYKGVAAHSGEHDSPAVKQEAERIKQILT